MCVWAWLSHCSQRNISTDDVTRLAAARLTGSHVEQLPAGWSSPVGVTGGNDCEQMAPSVWELEPELLQEETLGSHLQRVSRLSPPHGSLLGGSGPGDGRPAGVCSRRWWEEVLAEESHLQGFRPTSFKTLKRFSVGFYSNQLTRVHN